jgi:phage baseplate assembly protein W
MAVSTRKKRFNITELFSDFDIKMSAEGKDLKKSKDVDAIMNSLRNIVYTKTGERPMTNLDFGNQAHHSLFDQLDDETLRAIGESLVKTIEENEPRVRITNLNIEPPEKTADNNMVVVSVTVQIINYDADDTFKLDFYLNI